MYKQSEINVAITFKTEIITVERSLSSVLAKCDVCQMGMLHIEATLKTIRKYLFWGALIVGINKVLGNIVYCSHCGHIYYKTEIDIKEAMSGDGVYAGMAFTPNGNTDVETVNDSIKKGNG